MLTLRLIRRPRAANMFQKDIQDEVRKALNTLGDTSIKDLTEQIADWEDKPKFSKNVAIATKVWTLQVKVDSRTKAGKIYNWVDKGTGSRGGHKDYVIKPKKKNGMLRFSWPNHPKSMPNPGIPGFPQSDAVRGVITREVIHPGIYPRGFTNTMLAKLKANKSGSFRNTLEAAIKRAMRRR
jgi:hypothetical protein